MSCTLCRYLKYYKKSKEMYNLRETQLKKLVLKAGMGKPRPATELSTVHESLQQIQKRSKFFVKVKWPETLFPWNCLCWVMNVFVFINHAVYILHYLRVHHPILIGGTLWRFMAHWYGPRPEKFVCHCCKITQLSWITIEVWTIPYKRDFWAQ